MDQGDSLGLPTRCICSYRQTWLTNVGEKKKEQKVLSTIVDLVYGFKINVYNNFRSKKLFAFTSDVFFCSSKHEIEF